jgi:hypothetical protein
VAHILLSGLYKSNNFSRPFIVCTLRAQLGVKNGKKPVFSTVKSLTHGKTKQKECGTTGAAKSRREQKEKKARRKRRGKTGNLGRMRLTGEVRRENLVTGLLGFFSLDTLVDLFTVNGYFFRSVNADTHLVTLHP